MVPRNSGIGLCARSGTMTPSTKCPVNQPIGSCTGHIRPRLFGDLGVAGAAYDLLAGLRSTIPAIRSPVGTTLVASSPPLPCVVLDSWFVVAPTIGMSETTRVQVGYQSAPGNAATVAPFVPFIPFVARGNNGLRGCA